jgi:uncharacterized protein (TIGR03067 family)
MVEFYNGIPRSLEESDMLWTTAALLIALAPLAAEADAEPKTTPAAELKALEGTWEVVTYEVKGKPAAGESRVATIVISAGKIDLHETGEPDHPIKVDPTKSPKAIDVYIVGAMKAKAHVKGIYELKEGELKLCLPLSMEADRPAKFSSQNYHRLYVMRRKQ